MPNKTNFKYFKCVLPALVVAFAGGCGSAKPPVEKLAVADQMLKQAGANEASHYAPLEFRLASEKLEEARQAMEQEDYIIAERLADRSAMDARTALAKADSIRAQQTVNELKNSIELLRQELKSGANP